MNFKCLVSVVVPVYNAAKCLEDTLQSILNQTYSNLEIILVNDASIDESLNICERYASVDSRIKLINHQSNKGQSISRNDALNIAQGEYICFVDSDDLICQEAIERLVCESQKRDVDVLGFNAKVISSKNEALYAKCSYEDDVLTGEDYLIRMISSDQLYDVVWMFFYKASLINDNHIRFVEGRVFEDEIWVPQVLMSANKVSYLDYPAYNYFIREFSTMTRKDINFKKYNDALHNCKQLVQMSTKIKNAKNQHIFADYVVRIYMESTKYLIACDEYDYKAIDYKFIKENIFYRSTLIKYFVYRISKRLYFKLKGITI